MIATGVRSMITPMPPTRLNLGCGRLPVAGAVNLDISDEVGADIIHDLNYVDWPFANHTLAAVLAFDVIVHVQDVARGLDEIHRVGRHGAVARLRVPPFSCASASTDITHRQHFGLRSVESFLDAEPELAHYNRSQFRCCSVRIHFHPSPVNHLIGGCANPWPHAYEHRRPWMFPAWFMSVRFEVIKEVP